MATAYPPNTVVEWNESQKGAPLLCIDSYLFSNKGHGKDPAVRYWKCLGCKTYNCAVTAKTLGQAVVSLSGVVNSPDHGHANDTANISTSDFKVRVKFTMFYLTHTKFEICKSICSVLLFYSIARYFYKQGTGSPLAFSFTLNQGNIVCPTPTSIDSAYRVSHCKNFAPPLSPTAVLDSPMLLN